jgi:hypothetical protein
MNLSRFLSITGFTILLCIFFSFQANAQIDINVPTIEQTLSIEISPEIPKPNEEVEIYLGSSFFDADLAQYTWTVDGQVAKRGVGQNILVFTMKEAGKTTNISVSIIPPNNGAPFSHNFSFVSSEVDLLWQARTYTPPFYEGKSMLVSDADYIAVAIPQIPDGRGGIIPKESLFYTWKRNGVAYGRESGFGKYSFEVKGKDVRFNETLSVEVRNQNKTVAAKGELSIAALEPILNIFELHPLYGIEKQQELSSKSEFSLVNRELALVAEPFFFSLKKGMILPNIEYNWKLNGNTIAVPRLDNSITFRNESENKGTSVIEVAATNPNSIYQEALQRVRLKFGE